VLIPKKTARTSESTFFEVRREAEEKPILTPLICSVRISSFMLPDGAARHQSSSGILPGKRSGQEHVLEQVANGYDALLGCA